MQNARMCCHNLTFRWLCVQEKFLPQLGSDGHHVLAVSLRGHGRSGNSKCSDKYRQSIDDLAHVISCLSQPPVLVAHSMGGFFAQRLAAFPQY